MVSNESVRQANVKTALGKEADKRRQARVEKLQQEVKKHPSTWRIPGNGGARVRSNDGATYDMPSSASH